MNTKPWLTTIVFAVSLGTAGLIAQNKPEKVTVTGCVERADQVMSRESLAATVDSLRYVLIKAEDGPAQSQPAPVGTAGADADKAFNKAYRLDVDTDTMNLHVGHRVEIVGTVTTGAVPGPLGTTGRVAAGADVPANSPILKVETVKMISSTCGR